MNNMQFLFGSDGIKQAYEMSLNTTKLDIQCLSSNYEDIIGSYFDDEYSAKLYSGKIHTREILVDNVGNRKYGEGKDEGVNKVRFVNDKCETDVMIGDDFVVFVSFNLENPYAILNSDIEMVKAIKGMFEARWRVGNQ